MANTLSKADLVSAIAEKSGLSKADAEKALNGFTDSVKDTLAAGDSISLVGFGSFTVSQRNARKGRNPQTGAEIDIPASKVAAFKAGKALKDAVNA